MVVAVIFLALLAAAGLRSTPGVLMLPLQKAFGWDVSVISSSAAVGIFLYGLAGPFAAAVMQRFGIRRTVLGALALMSVSTAASYFMTAPWQLFLTWGLLSGIGSGAVANVLGATIVNRWFTTNRGLVMGLLTASTRHRHPDLHAGPRGAGRMGRLEAGGADGGGVLRGADSAGVLSGAGAARRDRPALYGSAHEDQPRSRRRRAIRSSPRSATSCARRGRRAFWFLFATFFICGFTTNGLVGTHLIAFCGDHGIFEVQAASLLALMGFFDLFGTTLSGWLTDRFDPRKLLFLYYGLRGAVADLPALLRISPWSACRCSRVFYGLDWIATVPPTVRIANEAFGDKNAPMMFGWVVAGHQLGAACAAFFAGFMRSTQGDYLQAFMIAGATGIVAAVLSLMIGRRPKQPVLATA